ncbi:uncharacterized protein V6R79_009821 [Siganus canaliculatus]
MFQQSAVSKQPHVTPAAALAGAGENHFLIKWNAPGRVYTLAPRCVMPVVRGSFSRRHIPPYESPAVQSGEPLDQSQLTDGVMSGLVETLEHDERRSSRQEADRKQTGSRQEADRKQAGNRQEADRKQTGSCRNSVQLQQVQSSAKRLTRLC